MNKPQREAKTCSGCVCHSTSSLFAASSEVQANFRVIFAHRYSEKTSLGEGEKCRTTAVWQISFRVTIISHPLSLTRGRLGFAG